MFNALQVLLFEGGICKKICQDSCKVMSGTELVYAMYIWTKALFKNAMINITYFRFIFIVVVGVTKSNKIFLFLNWNNN